MEKEGHAIRLGWPIGHLRLSWWDTYLRPLGNRRLRHVCTNARGGVSGDDDGN